MIDTMMIFHRCSGETEIFSTLGKVSRYMREHNLNPVHNNTTYGGASFGFEEIEFKYLRKYGYYAIHIKLRPKLLVSKNNYINTLYPSDIAALSREFTKKAKKMGLPNTDIMTYGVRRIDYAVDINIDPQKIPRYLALFKQGGIPKKLMNERTMRYFDSDTNMYLIGDGYNINFYDRYRTLVEKQANEPRKKYACVGRTKGKFRFEVQLKEIDTYKLKQRGFIKENMVGEFLNPILAKHIILQHYDSIIGQGDYVPYSEAIGKIKSRIAKDILRRIRTCGSIYAAKEQFVSEAEDKRKACKQFSEALNYIRDKNINPVTLNAYDDKLINPRNLICDYFDDRRTIMTRRCDT